MIFPKTVLALRGSDGVAKEGAMVGLRIRAWMRPLILLLFTVLGDTYPEKTRSKFTFLGNFCIWHEVFNFLLVQAGEAKGASSTLFGVSRWGHK